MSVPLADIEDDYIRRVERERRRREDELLVLLLALLTDARRQATTAAMHGFDFATVIRNVVTGSPNHRGAAPLLARASAQAHRDGYRRIGLAAGTTAVERRDAGSLAALAELYIASAREAASAMAAALIERIYEALRTRQPDVSIRETIRQGFDAGGYTPETPYAVDLATERAVVGAHNNGGMAAMRERPELAVKGAMHRSILDERTTDICRERHGLKLPLNSAYWSRNMCPLHWRCRSVIVPVFQDFESTRELPVTQPMAGFGQGPPPSFFMRAA